MKVIGDLAESSAMGILRRMVGPEVTIRQASESEDAECKYDLVMEGSTSRRGIQVKNSYRALMSKVESYEGYLSVLSVHRTVLCILDDSGEKLIEVVYSGPNPGLREVTEETVGRWLS